MTRYTFFRPAGFLTRSGDSLLDCLAQAEQFYKQYFGTFALIAWSEETPLDHGGTKPWDQLRDESIAAGRVIEKVDGKFIARGVEAKPAMTLGQLLRGALDKLHYPANQTKPAEPKRPALTWNAKTAFDAFPGFSVFSDTQDAPGYTGSFPTSDTASHQVTPKFGSSDLA